MARLIDADAFIAEHCDGCKYYKVAGICTKEDPVCGSVQIVTELPTIDAVEVVRCKDCVHMKNQFNARFCNVWCMYNGMGDEGFCNYGERKDNE